MHVFVFLILLCTLLPAVFTTFYGLIRLSPGKLAHGNIADRWWKFNKHAGLVFSVSVGMSIALLRSLDNFRWDITLNIIEYLPSNLFLIKHSFAIFINVVSLLLILVCIGLYFLAIGHYYRRLKSSAFSLFSYLRFALATFLSRNMIYVVFFVLFINRTKFVEVQPDWAFSTNWLTMLITLTATTLAFFYGFNAINFLFGINTKTEALDLRDKAKAMAATAGVKFDGIFSITTFNIPVAIAYATSDYKVYVSDTVKNLGQPYTDAIIAHEIGHFRHIKKLVLIKYAIYLGIIFSFSGLFPIIDAATSNYDLNLFVFAGELYFILYLLKLRGKISQRYETEADRTAAELVGSDAVITALEMIHEINLLPRKFNKKKEDSTMSHPSLEARIGNLTAAPAVPTAATDSTEA